MCWVGWASGCIGNFGGADANDDALPYLLSESTSLEHFLGVFFASEKNDPHGSGDRLLLVMSGVSPFSRRGRCMWRLFAAGCVSRSMLQTVRQVLKLCVGRATALPSSVLTL